MEEVQVTKTWDYGQGEKTTVETVNFMHIEPDSHYFTDINQILECLKYPSAFDRSHLITGLENTLNRGYNIQFVMPKTEITDFTKDPDIHKMD